MRFIKEFRFIIAVIVMILVMIAPNMYVNSLVWMNEPIDMANFVNMESDISTPKVEVLKSDDNGVMIEVNIPDIKIDYKDVDGKEFCELAIPGYGHTFDVGKPCLPVIRSFVAIPSSVDINLNVLRSEFFVRTIKNTYKIYPTQEPRREGDNDTTFIINEKTYSADAFFPNKLAEISAPGYLRDYRIVQLHIYPIQYNPVQNKLLFYNNLIVELKFKGLAKNESRLPPLYGNLENIYRTNIINYDAAKWWVRERHKTRASTGTLKSATNRGNYLIITNYTFTPAILSLVSLKEGRGWEVFLAEDIDIYKEFSASSKDESIHDFIVWAYNNWELPPYNILLVGDEDQLPTHMRTFGGATFASDHYYSTVDGSGDHYPDVCVGRLSGETISEIEKLRDKIIIYDNYRDNRPTTSWVDNVLLVAHKEGAPGKYQGCKEDIRTNIEKPPSSWVVAHLYGASKSADGDEATTQDVLDAVNAGRALLNYRGHGSSTSWSSWDYNSGSLTNSDVDGLTNGANLSVTYSICCSNNMIDASSDCHGEVWLNNENGGAITYHSASKLSYTTQNHDYDNYIFEDTCVNEMKYVGDVCMNADVRLLDYYGASNSYAVRNVLMYLTLGDPDTELVTYSSGTEGDNKPPSLYWTGEVNYENDGLDPEVGNSTAVFTYRVEYMDEDNDAPKEGYPKVWIDMDQDGLQNDGEWYQMNYVSGSYDTGAIYTYSTTLPDGEGYSYRFDAKDAKNATAYSKPLTAVDSPDIDSILPESPTNLTIDLDGSNLEDVIISWDLSNDDGAGEDDVAGYDIYCNTSYNSEGNGYSYLDSVSAGLSNYTHMSAGDGNTTNFYYFVVARDKFENENKSKEQVGKVVRDLTEGRQLVSIPLVQSNTNITEVLRTLEGNYNFVQWYDAIRIEDHWSTYSTSKPSGFNDLVNVDHTIALWITMTSPDNLTVVGKVPKNTTIQLNKGWNFVGYPCLKDRSVSDALGDLWSTKVTKIEGFDKDKPPYYLTSLSGLDIMKTGYGYWILAKEDCTWTIYN